MSNIFGFSTELSSGGDFTPIIKYDSRAGRIFRVDREQTTDGFVNNPVDITANFKAVVDFENVEVGWIDFPVGSAPSFALVPMGQQLPARPSAKHKNGIRMLVKLSKGCGGDKPVREIAGTSKAFLGGVEQVYAEYLREKFEVIDGKKRDKYPGQLPAISLVSTTPVVSGQGQTKSTNYRPTFRIEGWAKRPDDLVYTPVAAPTATNGSGAAPSTGGQTVPPPNSFQQGNAGSAGATNLDDDFG